MSGKKGMPTYALFPALRVESLKKVFQLTSLT
jgi:hypothetical protein